MVREITFAKAVREALEEEMREDKRVFLMGEDIHQSVWGVTGGMHNEFGEDRVMEMPICELGFSGVAVGAALLGYRPVVEIMYGDFALLASDPIANQAAKYRYMCGGGEFKVPVVYRITGNGIGNGGGCHHSQTLEAVFNHFPGLKIVYPSNPYDAKGLLKSAIRDDNPVLFFEHKMVNVTKGVVPEDPYTIPLGKADIKRTGKDITIVTYSYSCIKSLEAAERLAGEGIEAEVIDLRTIKPMDIETVLSSIEKTNKMIIVEEDYKTNGVGAEICAQVMEKGLEFLDAPVKRVAGADVPIPAGRYGEKFVVPSVEQICDAVKDLI